MGNEQMLVTLTVGQLRQIIREEVASELARVMPRQSKKIPKQNDTMTIEDVANYLNCSKATVHNHIKKGWLPKPYRIGRKVFWDALVIKDFKR